MTFPGFCPSGTRFGWTSFECIPTAFSLSSLLEEKIIPELPASSRSSSMTSALTVGAVLLGVAAAVAIGVAAANADTTKETKTP